MAAATDTVHWFHH